jgi:hypothetical protein
LTRYAELRDARWVCVCKLVQDRTPWLIVLRWLCVQLATVCQSSSSVVSQASIQVIATGDQLGRVKLFRFPCTSSKVRHLARTVHG